MERKYQVFISSTYEDLKAERSAVKDAVIDADCFPVGMELFPASPKSPWEFIEKEISKSDFYVLIVAGRYGSIDKGTGISYTEKEYNYAVDKKIPILLFLSGDLSKIDNKEKIERFREKLKNSGRQVCFYQNIHELKSKITKSLMIAIKNTADVHVEEDFDHLYKYVRDHVDFLQNQINTLAENSIRSTLGQAEIFERIRKLEKTIK